MDGWRQDVRQGLRLLVRNRAFSATAVVTLALGIGAAAAVFSVVDAVLLRPLPYAGAARLVRLSERIRALRPDRGSPPALVTSDTFQAWRVSAKTLDALAAYSPRSYTLTGLGDPVRLRGTAVSASMFPMLGVVAERGRLFEPGEERAGADRVAILSDGLWTRRFGRDPGIVGRVVALDDQPVTVVGVLPASFAFPDRESEIWTPLTVDPGPQPPGRHFIMGFSAIARLKPGVTIAQAEAEGTSVAAHAQLPPPPGAAGVPPAGMRLVPLGDEMVANVRPALLVLAGAVAFVLLIAAGNVANLLLARGAARQRELAVRTALGAGRGRLIRQLLIESVALALAGGAAGVALAGALQHAMPALAPGNIPRLDQAVVDWRVLGFAGLLSTATGLLFGIAPALQGSRTDVLRTLNEAGVQHAAGFRFLEGNRTRGALVVAEVALSIVLLAGAGLLVRSFVRLIDVDPGYDPANVVTAQVSLPAARYGAPPLQRAFFDQLLERVSAIPGVNAAGVTNLLPLLPGNIVLTFGIQGEPDPTDPAEMPHASVRIVSPGYGEAMRLRLVAGRLLSARDRPDAPTVAVVNRSLAAQYFPGGQAVGKRIRLFGPEPVQVVGVVGDVRHGGLDAGPQPELYLSVQQVPDRMRFAGPAPTALVVRSAGDPLALVPFLRRAVLDVDPDVPLDNVMTMEARVAASVARPRFYAVLLGAFALLALVLAAVGVYGVLSCTVAQRRREIGVRMALGAERGHIHRLVVGQGLRLIALGVALGLAGALGATRLLSGLLFGVGAADPVSYAAATALLVLVALAACWLPARRATRLDPMAALRCD